MVAPGGWLALMCAREASAADSVCWKQRKEVRMAGTWVAGSMMPTATASIDSSLSFAAWGVLEFFCG